MKLFRKKKNRDINLHLDLSLLDELIEKYNIQQWFKYAAEKWNNREHIWRGLFYISNKLSKRSRILETGCGIGLNLIWLAQRRFRYLYGFDIDESTIQASIALAKNMNYTINYYIDNGLIPKIKNQTFDLIIALNWTYHLADFDMKTFFDTYSPLVSKKGFILIDCIDKSFNNHPKNQYLTSDWDKPIEKRQVSEYKVRYSWNDLYKISEKCGFKIIKQIEINHVIPKTVYVLRKK